jgi:hypothetical protein
VAAQRPSARGFIPHRAGDHQTSERPLSEDASASDRVGAIVAENHLGEKVGQLGGVRFDDLGEKRAETTGRGRRARRRHRRPAFPRRPLDPSTARAAGPSSRKRSP